jgi:hypothetical protein
MVASTVTERPIVKALIAAKQDFGKLLKNKVNPHFKSRYADLSAVCNSVDEALAKHGLTYVQPFEMEGGAMFIVTKLLHTGGEEMVSKYPVPVGGKPQELGSAITYGRRFSLCSLLGIAADEDDDANEAQSAPHEAPKPPAPRPLPLASRPSVPTWRGKILKVDEIKSKDGKVAWKITGQMGEEFWTQSPAHADVASSVMGSEKQVVMLHHKKDQSYICDSVDPVMEGGK